MRLLTFLLFITISFCSCKCRKDSKEAETAAEYAGAEYIAPAQAVIRLTPEQISRQLKQALQFELGWTDDDGRFHDLIIEQYGVPLGGIDFISANKRDPIPKVQTLLLIRRIAYDVAAAVVWREAKPDTNGPLLFQHCDLTTDHPILPEEREDQNADIEMLQAQEDRWLAQLEDFYWRLYGRPPRAAELDLLRSTAIDIMQREQWPPTVWVLVLYALLSSQEFWTV